MIKLEIPQEPYSWQPARISKRGAYDPLMFEKKTARLLLKAQYKEEPLKGYVGLLFEFIFPIPKGASKKRREKMLQGEIFPTKRDTTNCQKFYEDCLKGIVIEDDRTVVIICSEKKYGEEGLVKIQINPINKLEDVNLG